MYTLKDVAQFAGVSTATVSYYLNGKKNLKPETKLKIMEAIEKLGYIPNSSARNLKCDTSNDIGVILSNMDDHYHAEIFKGIFSYAESRNYNLNIAFSNDNPKLECKKINEFLTKNVAGIILTTCQPDRTSFFGNTLERHGLPAVFVDNYPENMDVNFLSFDNSKTIYHMTVSLLEQGFSQIALMIGPGYLSFEKDCIRGFVLAHEEKQEPFDPLMILKTTRTKEDAFKSAMQLLIQNRPQAIITSSVTIAKGVCEALQLLEIHIPQDMCLLTLGEECWNSSEKLPQVIHSARTAFTLGMEAGKLLIENIEEQGFFEKRIIHFADSITEQPLKLPPPPQIKVGQILKRYDGLSILTTDLPTVHSALVVSNEFTAKSGISLHFESLPLTQLLDAIVEDAKKKQSQYDIYLYDIPWLRYLASQELLLDLSGFTGSSAFPSQAILRENFGNCCYRNSCYGIPLIGGLQILFYRKDLFETPGILNQFQEKHHISLRPPKTWTEFNGITKFFTRSINPDSPTLYGTSVAGNLREEFIMELLPRLWGAGGSIYDSNGKIQLNTHGNVKGFLNLLETCRYIEHDPFHTSITNGFQDFDSGKTAMLVACTEYAAQIRSQIHSDVIEKVGYCCLPRSISVKCGWNLGVSKTTPKTEAIFSYFRWLCSKNASYYMTILDGQSPLVYPYQSHELLRLYPWLSLTLESQEYCRSRIYPCKTEKEYIPPNRVEAILCDAFYDCLHGQDTPESALKKADTQIRRLFSGKNQI